MYKCNCFFGVEGQLVCIFFSDSHLCVVTGNVSGGRGCGRRRKRRRLREPQRRGGKTLQQQQQQQQQRRRRFFFCTGSSRAPSPASSAPSPSPSAAPVGHRCSPNCAPATATSSSRAAADHVATADPMALRWRDAPTSSDANGAPEYGSRSLQFRRGHSSGSYRWRTQGSRLLVGGHASLPPSPPSSVLESMQHLLA